MENDQSDNKLVWAILGVMVLIFLGAIILNSKKTIPFPEITPGPKEMPTDVITYPCTDGKCS